MSWYNKGYRRRQMVGVDVFGGSGSSATIDIEFQIPKDWDSFWSEIRSDFNDVVVTDPSGNLLTFARKAGAVFATRTLILQVDGYACNHDNSMNALWVYYAYPDETTDHSSSVTITAPKTGYITLEAPYSRVVPSRGGQSATDSPIASFSKAQTDEIDVFFMTSGLLGRRLENYNNRDFLEAIDYVEIFSYDSSGSDASARYDTDETRLGNNFIRARYRAGDNGSDYAVAVKFVTTEKQTIESRAILRVKNLLPS